ncbi:hypothetical protein [Amycolatopsis sp. MtRt-6]|uniref:hypothetical protein n=1 Tax=Amycolatopsis sp. MtRt-6 TaxID=2792782 RepID=UPI001A905C8D|nr:hypothetical protein [Amycolatopsis sp. MtRt-6]
MSTEHPEYPPEPEPRPEEDDWGSGAGSPIPPKHRPAPGNPLPDLDSEDGPPPRRGGPTG